MTNIIIALFTMAAAILISSIIIGSKMDHKDIIDSLTTKNRKLEIKVSNYQALVYTVSQCRIDLGETQTKYGRYTRYISHYEAPIYLTMEQAKELLEHYYSLEDFEVAIKDGIFSLPEMSSTDIVLAELERSLPPSKSEED